MPFGQTSRRHRAIATAPGKTFRLADYFSGLLVRLSTDLDPGSFK